MRTGLLTGRRAGPLVAALGAVALATPAQAAETGAARLLAGAGDVTASVGSCSMWSSAAGGYGMRCSGGGRAGDTFRTMLAGAPVPTCWLLPADTPREDLTPVSAQPFGLTAPVGLTPDATPTANPSATPSATPSASPTGTPPATPTGTAAPEPQPTGTVPAPVTDTPTTPVELPEQFLQVCVDGHVDPVTAAPARTAQLVWATVTLLRSDPGRPPFWFELTAGQRRWATWTDERNGNLDPGSISTSPSRTPRIGQVVAFSAVGARALTVGVGDYRMRAVLERFEVDTGEPGRAPVVCAGAGLVLAPGATERTGEGICSFTYSETSGGRQGGPAPDTYAVVGTEHWQIQYSDDDGASWKPHRDVERTVTAGLRVTEVQTLVVPLAP
ncbi:hypothetical protein [Kineococcus sp. SYSU DK003]|uniref:hypothetical protein n=1 Tax=Kineococcus sp. SYSU DK003 TaxID=3383124 RepID=UPI003D7D9DE6